MSRWLVGLLVACALACTGSKTTQPPAGEDTATDTGGDTGAAADDDDGGDATGTNDDPPPGVVTGNTLASAALAALVSSAFRPDGALVSADDFCANLGTAPASFFVMPAGPPATMGASIEQKALTPTDYCMDMSTHEPNSGMGGDAQGLFAMFRLLGEPAIDCNDAEAIVTTGFGVVRVNTAEAIEILGRFTLEGEPLDCTLSVSAQGDVTGDCTDADGGVVAGTQTIACAAFEPPAPPTPSFIKGHWGLNDPGTLQYPCIFPAPNGNTSIETALNDPDALFPIDCSGLLDAGFNTVVVGVTFQVSSTTGETTATLDGASIHSAIAILHSVGLNVALEANYVITGDDGSSDDSHQAFESLLASAVADTYLASIGDIALDFADIAERHGADALIPFMEIDKALGADYAAASDFAAARIDALRARFSGRIAWIASGPEFDVGIDLTGFDIFGFNLGPLQDEQLEAFTTRMNTGVSRMTTLCAAYSEVACFITSMGFWGSGIRESTYWFEPSDNYLNAFMTVFEATDTNSLVGLNIFDGSSERGELAIGEDPTLLGDLEAFFAQH